MTPRPMPEGRFSVVDAGLPGDTVVMRDPARAISLERSRKRRGQRSAEALRRVEYAVRAEPGP